MRKPPLPSSLLLSFTIFLLIFAPYYINTTFGEPVTEIQVNQLQHTVRIYGGALIINDTVTISAKPGSKVTHIRNFSLGFPLEYGFNLVDCFAYNTSHPDERLPPPILDAGLGKSGYYGVNVMLTAANGGQGVKITAQPYNLTVIFVLSTCLSSKTTFNPLENKTITLYAADFPMYPSLTENVAVCNSTIILPAYDSPNDLTIWNSSLVVVNNSIPVPFYDSTISGSHAILNYVKKYLPNFTNAPGFLNFYIQGEGMLPITTVDEIRREINLNREGTVSISDFYHINNKGREELSSIKIPLPQGAYAVKALDQFGNILDEKPTQMGNTTMYKVSLQPPLKENESIKFELTYCLPTGKYVNQQGWDQFNLSFTLFDKMDWLVNKFTVTVVLPEGAKITSFQSTPHRTYHIHKDVFQEKISLTFHDVTPFTPVHVNLTYQHPVLWASFRPTLWVGMLVAIGCAVALVWRAQKPSAPVVRMPVRPKALKNFVETYEEKTTVLSKLESLRKMGRKGKISRRQYKVKQRMLERQDSKLSKDLDKLRQKIGAAGAGYAETMSQLEVAEAKLETAKGDIRKVKSQYRRGELSRKAYRQLLEEYEERKDQAETMIDGILIRLREETR